MKSFDYIVSGKKINCIFDVSFEYISNYASKENTIIITDDLVWSLFKNKMEGYKVIRFPSGENFKNQKTVDDIINQLLDWQVSKNCLIVGIGGGVVTDIAGYVASIYKRGVRLGLIPTTILGMVDASLGGKNGVDVGMYKNMVGTIYQPDFILFDFSFLDSLPVKEWINGFAEIIKHACIKDAAMFTMLEKNNLHEFQSDKTLIAELIIRNVAIKYEIVIKDEFDNADRRLLNFGHTVGHAIENLYNLPHGHAVSIGIVAACNLSEKINNLHFSDAKRVVDLLAKYHLPVDMKTDFEKVFQVIKLDKKREGDCLHFVMLNKIGSAETRAIEVHQLYELLKNIL